MLKSIFGSLSKRKIRLKNFGLFLSKTTSFGTSSSNSTVGFSSACSFKFSVSTLLNSILNNDFIYKKKTQNAYMTRVAFYIPTPGCGCKELRISVKKNKYFFVIPYSLHVTKPTKILHTNHKDQKFGYEKF